MFSDWTISTRKHNNISCNIKDQEKYKVRFFGNQVASSVGKALDSCPEFVGSILNTVQLGSALSPLEKIDKV